MPMCKKCGLIFKNRQFVEGKWRNVCKRKYCFVCSPFGGRNTRKLEVMELAKKNGDVLGYCSYCGREFVAARRRNGNLISTKTCASCQVNRRRFRRKEIMVKYKGGRCNRCGYNKCLDALEFHHIDPNEKDFSFSGAHCRRLDILKKEVDKCELVCANCHAEIHSKRTHSSVA